MQVMQVVSDLVATRRVPNLYAASLRVVRDHKDRLSVAVDAVSARPGDWVITVATSAARYAAGDYRVTTDLTIAGIIDYWEGESGRHGKDEPQQEGATRRRTTAVRERS